MEKKNIAQIYSDVQNLISQLQSHIINKRNTVEIYEDLRWNLKNLIESTFAENATDFLLQKDYFKMILNTYNLMMDIDQESQLHALEFASVIIGKMFL